MRRDFERLAIVNRGEPAMRLIHAVRELNRERDWALKTIALFTEPDRRAMFVRQADIAVPLGPATYVDPRDGRRRVAYLDYDRLSRALVQARAEAVWVGWGFVAEHAEFAELCRKLGIVFIGPSPEVMRKLGDKISSKLLAEEAGVPVAPWSSGAVATIEEAKEHAERIGFPLMIKATAGGGGRGIRAVYDLEGLAPAFESAQAEALGAFGDKTVFLEKRVGSARHIEVQVIGDEYGHVWACGVRDCTIQRRHQKVIEEAPSPALSPEEDKFVRDAAKKLAERAGYTNAGTVELLFEPGPRRFSFMEVNARLQVEHPVTEATTGLDLVKLQIHVARGGELVGQPPEPRGHAMEVRVNAEDPERDFAPAPGQVDLLRLPTGPGLRIDSGIAEGDTIPAEFDSMVGKLIAWGSSREEALARLAGALADTALVIRGGTSNKAFLLDLLKRPEIVRADVDNTWLDGFAARGGMASTSGAEIALIAVALDAYQAEAALEQSQFFAEAARGRPKVGEAEGFATELRYRGQAYGFVVRQIAAQRFEVVAKDGPALEVKVEIAGRRERRLTVGERTYRILSIAEGLEQLVEVDGVPHRVSLDAGGAVRSPSPAVVLRIPVSAGDKVAEGDRVAVLEAMKMEMAINAPSAGRVREVLVNPNTQVQAGAPLLIIEPLEGVQEVSKSERVALPSPSSPGDSPEEAFRCVRELLLRLMLGYDVPAAQAKGAAAVYKKACERLLADDPELCRAEEEAFGIFADVQALFRRQPTRDESSDAPRASTEEHLLVYLRALESDSAALPASFKDKLVAALSHYGVTSLDPSPSLREALVRLWKARARGEEQAAVISAALDRRRLAAGALVASAGDAFHVLVDRLVLVSRRRFPAVHEAALEVRHVFFDEPMFQRARQAVHAGAGACLRELQAVGAHDTAAREARIDALVECPEPLLGLFAPHFLDAVPTLRAAMLEVLLRRYYRIRTLSQVEVAAEEHCPHASAWYPHEGQMIRAVATCSRLSDLQGALRRAARLLQGSDPAWTVLDLYVFSDQKLGQADELEANVRAALRGGDLPADLRRVVVVLQGPAREDAHCFTYRGAEPGFIEETFVRGLHPMLGKRMHLFRLRNFHLTRLPSSYDVYLFRGVAKENPRDERLFCIAEVRDLSPVRDASGRIVQLPYLERMLAESLSAIRLAQSARPARERYVDNRVLLYLWPPLDLSRTDLHQVIRKLAPETEGLGIDQVIVRARMPDASGDLIDRVLRISNPMEQGVHLTFHEPSDEPVPTLSEYEQKVQMLRRRGLLYPYEIVKLLAPPSRAAPDDIPPGEFIEYDLSSTGALVPVNRPPGKNEANIVVGVVRSFSRKVPEGATRVILLGDPSHEMGSLAEPECRRILAALALAEKMRVPIEWFALSAGAKISMQSGTENMDWISAVLRGIIEYTQRGGEINVVVCGINVGAQPYWNAEATMLMHTRGILVMLPDSAMVLTGKQALDYSGSVSAEDNAAIGGYQRIMGPNGQAQYWAEDIGAACRLLLRHYEHTYIVPGERFPRRAETTDPTERDVRAAPHPSPTLPTIGDVLGDKNPDRKLPFEIRAVMRAVVDADHEPLERWRDMRDAEIAVVWDAHLGGYPVCLLGLQSHPLPRQGFVPADGPEQWTAGTLFPRSSKKLARAINGASGNRPCVVLANLSGFDGSPESMRSWQLEYGAEIGRAVVNFQGPFVFAVVSRYHGGAFVVFSKRLNDRMEVVAIEGARASVIGGAPAAAVVFSREVDGRTTKDRRVMELSAALAKASGAEKAALRAELAEVTQAVRSEKLGQVAEEFDRIHSVERALRVGSLDRILPASDLRPYLVRAVERGIQKVLSGGA